MKTSLPKLLCLKRRKTRGREPGEYNVVYLKMGLEWAWGSRTWVPSLALRPPAHLRRDEGTLTGWTGAPGSGSLGKHRTTVLMDCLRGTYPPWASSGKCRQLIRSKVQYLRVKTRQHLRFKTPQVQGPHFWSWPTKAAEVCSTAVIPHDPGPIGHLNTGTNFIVWAEKVCIKFYNILAKP